MTGKHAWAIVLELREAGMTVGDIAERIRCTRPTIYAWRRQTSRVSPAIAENLNDLLEEVAQAEEG